MPVLSTHTSRLDSVLRTKTGHRWHKLALGAFQSELQMMWWGNLESGFFITFQFLHFSMEHWGFWCRFDTLTFPLTYLTACLIPIAHTLNEYDNVFFLGGGGSFFLFWKPTTQMGIWQAWLDRLSSDYSNETFSSPTSGFDTAAGGADWQRAQEIWEAIGVQNKAKRNSGTRCTELQKNITLPLQLCSPDRKEEINRS